MVLVFADDTEPSHRRAMTFASAGDARARRDMLAAVERGFLITQIDHDPRATLVPLRQMRRDEIADGRAGVQRQSRETDEKKRAPFHEGRSCRQHAARA